MAFLRFKKRLRAPADTGRTQKTKRTVKRVPPVAMEVKVLAIPHNGNLSNGLMFSMEANDGKPYTPELAALRASLEPLIEVTQIKGRVHTSCLPVLP